MNKLRKIAYSSASIAFEISYSSFGAFILFFYVDVVKLGVGLAGLGMAIWGVWNALNDPVFGLISDRTRTPWGRRVPYLVASAIPFGLVYFLMWTPPFGLGQQALLFAYYLIFICLFDLFYSIATISWSSLFPEMFKTPAERSEVNTYRQAFTFVGVLMGVALPPLIYSTLGWQWMGAAFAAVIIISIFVSLLGSSEKKEAYQEKPLPLKEILKFTFMNRSMITFVLSYLFVQFVIVLIQAVIPFYTKYVLGLSPKATSMLLLILFLVCIITMFIWRYVNVRLGTKNTYVLGCIILGVCFLPFLVVKGFLPALITSALCGVGLAGVVLTRDLLIADIIDEDVLKTRGHHEGIYFGFTTFVRRLSIMLKAGSFSLVFMITGYNASLAVQPEAFLTGLRILSSFFPFVALILAIVIIRYYPLDKKRVAEIRAELDKTG
ncbi:MAG: MFS transporter [Candidatus Margulisiibacteriota bacterium]|nr:MFS transporter [Candidatus Margulisiibacteriota bacterium]